MSTIIAITGGIGSGKSIVSRILRAHSYTVYDCDSEAKRLMDIDTDIHDKLNKFIHPQAVVDRRINRPLIAEIVFSSAEKLSLLNSIVHHAVIEDLRHINVGELPHNILFIETAILYQSHIDEMADSVWEVSAPLEVRIERVMQRNSCSREQVISRINSQDNFKPSKPHPSIHTIINDGVTPLLPQIKGLLGYSIADRTSRHL